MRIMRRKKSDYEPHVRGIYNIYIQLTEDEATCLFNLGMLDGQSLIKFCETKKLDFTYHRQVREQLCDGLYKMLIKTNTKKGD